MAYNPAFDEANYYQGNTFQLGGLDRGLALDNGFSSRRRMSGVRADERIQEDAWRALIRNHKINLAGIEILVKSGTVKLFGLVGALSEKQEAEKTLEIVPGILEIINDLKVTRTHA